jgi:hypothetical protein
MPELIDRLSDEVMDDVIMQSKLAFCFDDSSAPNGPIKTESVNDNSVGVIQKYQEEMRGNSISEVQMKDVEDVKAHITPWQGLKGHDIVQQRQEQEFTEINKK